MNLKRRVTVFFSSSYPVQDALAVAVAEEMHKVYKKELAPAPVPLTVPGEAITEEDVRNFNSFKSSHIFCPTLYKLIILNNHLYFYFSDVFS